MEYKKENLNKKKRNNKKNLTLTNALLCYVITSCVSIAWCLSHGFPQPLANENISTVRPILKRKKKTQK